MSPAEIVACTSLAILFYCYVGYGILVWLLALQKKKRVFTANAGSGSLPPLTLIITSYNERQVLPAKIANCLALDYPPELIHILFVTDGSTDGSELLLQQHPGIKVIHQQQRMGKYAAIKRAMATVKTPIVVFSDANAMLNEDALIKLTRHFEDARIGAVAGEKIVLAGPGSTVGQAEGLYWKYESFMKKRDAELYTVVGAAGELFALRTNLFKALEREVILDDFIISINVCLEGYRIAYEPCAFAAEPASVSLAEETKRKVRIAAGACQALGLVPQCMNVFKHPLLAFQYISRRVLRWLFCPSLLIVLFFTSMYSGLYEGSVFCYWIFIAQVIFYVGAIAGWIMVRKGRPAGILAIPFYFVFMNTCMLRGFVRFLTGKQTVLWERSVREVNA